MYDGERGIALDTIQENPVSSQIDLGYTKLFHISFVTSVSFLTCEVGLVDSLEFKQGNQGSLRL